MDDEGTPENKHGTKRPRRDTSASDGSRLEPAPMTSERIESPAIDAGEDTPQPRDEQTPPKSHGGGRAGGRKRDGRVFAADVRAYSDISPLPQQHPRLSNDDLPGCIVRQDFHCAVLSDAFGQPGVEQCLSFHPNGLAVVQLAPTHPAAGTGDRAIVAADFDAGGCNVLESAVVTGKKKKGALQLHPATVLCSVTTKGGEQYKVCTGISGELIQANKMLADSPELMSEDPLGRGWVAIIRLKPRDLRRLQEALGVVEER